jgi:hypothetical protein
MVKQAADVFSLPGEIWARKVSKGKKGDLCNRATIWLKENNGTRGRTNRATWVMEGDMGSERQNGFGKAIWIRRGGMWVMKCKNAI